VSASRPPNNDAALDHDQVRLRKAWYRYAALAMLALAGLTVTGAIVTHDSDDLLTSADEILETLAADCNWINDLGY
jgi:hypothetical protein